MHTLAYFYKLFERKILYYYLAGCPVGYRISGRIPDIQQTVSGATLYIMCYLIHFHVIRFSAFENLANVNSKSANIVQKYPNPHQIKTSIAIHVYLGITKMILHA